MFKKFVRCELSLDGIPALEKMVDVKNVHKKVLSFVSSRRFGKWHTLTYMTGVFWLAKLEIICFCFTQCRAQWLDTDNIMSFVQRPLAHVLAIFVRYCVFWCGSAKPLFIHSGPIQSHSSSLCATRQMNSTAWLLKTGLSAWIPLPDLRLDKVYSMRKWTIFQLNHF